MRADTHTVNIFVASGSRVNRNGGSCQSVLVSVLASLRAKTRTLCHPPSWRLATKILTLQMDSYSNVNRASLRAVSEAIQYSPAMNWIASLTLAMTGWGVYSNMSAFAESIFFVARRQLGGWQSVLVFARSEASTQTRML